MTGNVIPISSSSSAISEHTSIDTNTLAHTTSLTLVYILLRTYNHQTSATDIHTPYQLNNVINRLLFRTSSFVRLCFDSLKSLTLILIFHICCCT